MEELRYISDLFSFFLLSSFYVSAISLFFGPLSFHVGTPVENTPEQQHRGNQGGAPSDSDSGYTDGADSGAQEGKLCVGRFARFRQEEVSLE